MILLLIFITLFIHTFEFQSLHDFEQALKFKNKLDDVIDDIIHNNIQINADLNYISEVMISQNLNNEEKRKIKHEINKIKQDIEDNNKKLRELRYNNFPSYI